MKKYISIIALLSLFVVGCSEQLSINSPVENIAAEPNWISLPALSGNANGLTTLLIPVVNENQKTMLEVGENQKYGPIFELAKIIRGNRGGSLKIEREYAGGPFGKIEVKVELKFPKDSFIGTKNITMRINSSFGNAIFSPHGSFEKCAVYNAEFRGLDLTGMDPECVDFVYKAENGTYEYIEKSKIEIDLLNGVLKVKEAKLPHFSRYGFIRKENGPNQ